MKDDLAFSDDELRKIHGSTGIAPLVNQEKLSLLNMAEASLHMSNVAELQDLIRIVETPQDINEHTAGPILAQLSYGFRKAGEYAALAEREYANAKKDRETAEAIAFLDRVLIYASEKGVKVTDKLKEYYIDIDPEVTAASRKESMMKAVFSQLLTIKTEFLMAISSTKGKAYGYKDSNSMSGGSHAVTDNE